MSRYYHAFKIGFNWWMVFIPAAFVLVGVMGWFSAYLDRHGRVKSLSNDSLMFLSVLIGLGLPVLLFRESIAGIIQLFDNMLSGSDSAMWSIFFALFALPAIYVSFFLLLKSFSVSMKERRIRVLKRQAWKKRKMRKDKRK